MRPWLNWIEQQISNLWVAGSSPAGRARKTFIPHETFAFMKKHVIMAGIRGVAQPGRVLGLGPRCRRFEPSHPDQLNKKYRFMRYFLFNIVWVQMVDTSATTLPQVRKQVDFTSETQ